MRELIDLTGQRFGMLTVVKRVYVEPNNTYWLCKCDCGNTTTVVSQSLRNGRTKSCGCSKVKLRSLRCCDCKHYTNGFCETWRATTIKQGFCHNGELAWGMRNGKKFNSEQE